MSTLTELRVRFREILKLADQTDVDEGDPAKDTITKLINEARNRRYAQLVTSYPFKFLTMSTAFTYTANAENVSLPAAAQGRMISVVRALPLGTTSSIESYPLSASSLDEFNNWAFYGTPAVYIVDMLAKVMWLRPIPQSDTTLYLHYNAALTALSADGNTPSELPAEFHQLLAYDAAVMYRQESGDESAAVLEARAEAIYDSLKIYVERNYQDTRFKQRQRLLY